MLTKSTFQKAKKLLKNHHHWRQGIGPPGPTYCLGQALDTVELGSFFESQAFFSNNGLLPRGSYNIIEWNDAPGRTVEDVYALLDKAIELAPKEAPL